MSTYEPLENTSVEITQKLMEAVYLYSKYRLPIGLEHAKFNVAVKMATEDMVCSLTAYVLGEDAGPTHTEAATWIEKLKPRYMPQWLWNRLKTEQHKVVIEIRPMYIYPESSIGIPDLGKPIPIYQYSGTVKKILPKNEG
jgi:hypothetical protein